MTTQEYIESGILELYITGKLSEPENLEVLAQIRRYPEVAREVEQIEKAMLELTADLAPTSSKRNFGHIKPELRQSKEVMMPPSSDKSHVGWVSWIGWAAAIAFAVCASWLLIENKTLNSEITLVKSQEEILKNDFILNQQKLTDQKQLLSVLRNPDYTPVILDAQPDYPDAFATIYWNKASGELYLDGQSLPEPPEGMVYQLWSLTLDPLTPTSLGTIDDFSLNENKIFVKKNFNETEAFGITLEPSGGSDVPSLDKLYSLGVINAG